MHGPRARIGSMGDFLKKRLSGSKTDFSQNQDMLPSSSKLFLGCSLRLFWPPHSVVSMWVPLVEIFKNSEFWAILAILRNSSIWADPPPHILRRHIGSEKSHHRTWECHIYGGGTKPLGGKGFIICSNVPSMLSPRSEFWYRWFPSGKILDKNLSKISTILNFVDAKSIFRGLLRGQF